MDLEVQLNQSLQPLANFQYRGGQAKLMFSQET